jgi:hypothetical protein
MMLNVVASIVAASKSRWKDRRWRSEEVLSTAIGVLFSLARDRTPVAAYRAEELMDGTSGLDQCIFPTYFHDPCTELFNGQHMTA